MSTSVYSRQPLFFEGINDGIKIGILGLRPAEREENEADAVIIKRNH